MTFWLRYRAEIFTVDSSRIEAPTVKISALYLNQKVILHAWKNNYQPFAHLECVYFEITSAQYQMVLLAVLICLSEGGLTPEKTSKNKPLKHL